MRLRILLPAVAAMALGAPVFAQQQTSPEPAPGMRQMQPMNETMREDGYRPEHPRRDMKMKRGAHDDMHGMMRMMMMHEMMHEMMQFDEDDADCPMRDRYGSMRHRGATGQMEDRGDRRVEMENQLDEIRQQIEEMRAMIESLIAEPAEPKE